MCACACGREDGWKKVLQAQREPRCLLAQLPGQGGGSSSGRSRTAFGLLEKVTHCRYKPANQQLAQRCSQCPLSPQCSSAPQSSASQARFPRPFNGLPRSKTHLRHPSPCSPLSLACLPSDCGERGLPECWGGGGWPGLVRYVPLSGVRRRDLAEGGGGRCL